MDGNPYQSPSTFYESPAPIVDGDERGRLAALLRRFLQEEITAFALDEAAEEFRDSRDSAVRFVSQAVWYHYDDCVDHLAALSKPEWDYFQRLLLLLESQCVVEESHAWMWSGRQVIAVAAVADFAFLAIGMGWGMQLFLLTIPFGLASIAIAHAEPSREPTNPWEPILYPFQSFGELATAYRAVGFRKARYPRHLGERTVRTSLDAVYSMLHTYAVWTLFSPVVLLFQALPERQRDICVRAG